MRESGEPRVGMVGVGTMGRPMARHLLAARGTLALVSSRPQTELVAAGAVQEATPRALASRSDVVVSMLPDLPQLETLLTGDDGLVADSPELILAIGSTSSPTEVRALGARLRDTTDGRTRVVDCPVSGGEDGAIAGTLSIMAGGEAVDVATVAAALAPCGSVVHLGPLGAGEVAKACNQLVVAATITALGEASVLAERSGIDLQVLWDLLGGGYAGSRLLESRKDRLVRGDDTPSGMAQYMVKDLRFAADVAAATETGAAMLPVLQGVFDGIVAAGLGTRDIAVTRRFIADRAPLTAST